MFLFLFAALTITILKTKAMAIHWQYTDNYLYLSFESLSFFLNHTTLYFVVLYLWICFGQKANLGYEKKSAEICVK